MSLTEEQEKWLEHLSSEKMVKIVPFDKTAEEKFQKIKSKIQSTLGEDVIVEHRGSSSLGISGQDEIDVYIPTATEQFDDLFPKLVTLFGEPRSLYPYRRIRFTDNVDGKHVDIFLINKDSPDWLDGLEFEAYMKAHPEELKAYEKLKADMNGYTSKNFYREKILFINNILEKINKLPRPIK